METFKDLKFKPHSVGEGLSSQRFFTNGFGVSVVRFTINGMKGSYTNNDQEWELAVLKGNKNDWELTYDTPITEDVIGYLSEDEVTEIMKKIQQLLSTHNFILN